MQEKVAATILKANIAAEKSAVLALLGATQQDNSSLANVSAGIGGSLNVTAERPKARRPPASPLPRSA